MATTNTPGTAASALPTAGGSSASTLSTWAGPYVTNMLGRAEALSNEPYQVYQGAQVAGGSPLQQQAFQGLGNLTVPNSINQAANTAGQIAGQTPGAYAPNQFNTNSWSNQFASDYMNPYMQQVLNPQLDEIRRQADISRVQNAGRLGKAGAYGGSRQAVMESEGQRNMLDMLSQATGRAYDTAYNSAMGQFNNDQNRALQGQQATEASRQFGANYGLQGLQQQLQAAQAQGQLGSLANQTELANLNAQLLGGQTERGIEQEGLTADYNEFLAQRDYPLKQTQFLQSMLQGLPISTVTNQPLPMSTAGNISQALGGAGSLYEQLKTLGIIT